jgi:hypothetical protein
MVTFVTPGGIVRSCSAPVSLKVTEPVHWPDALQLGVQVAPVGQLTAQSTQAVPAAPHAAVEVPGLHAAPAQQAPLHGDDALQAEEHAPALHALPERQSDSVLQPQVPLLRHAEPLLPVQSLHFPPGVPQASEAVPGWHVVPLQHPPLHVKPPAQLFPHRPVAVSQASPFGQLPGAQGTKVSWPESGAASRAASRSESRATSRPASWLESRLSATTSREASVGGTVPSVAPSAHEPTQARPSSSREQAATEPAAAPAVSTASAAPSQLCRLEPTVSVYPADAQCMIADRLRLRRDQKLC